MKKYRDRKEHYEFDELIQIVLDPGEMDELAINCDKVIIEHYKNNIWFVETYEHAQRTSTLTLEATFKEIPDDTTKIEFANYTVRLIEKVF